VRILYLFPKSLYETKMSVGRVLYGEAVSRQPGIELRWWGEGWDGYDNSLTVSENIERSGLTPDVLWAYKADRLKDCASAPGKHVVCFNEAWHEKTALEIQAAGAHVLIFHHEGDMPLWEPLGRTGTKLVHIPHGADPAFFCGGPALSERPIDCLLTGVNSPAVYPLRDRFRRMILESRLPGQVRQHPGYRLASQEACRRQYEGYAENLKLAKVALCCSSRHRYWLAKITEAMMAGCCVVTDDPDDSEFRCLFMPMVHYVPVEPAEDDVAICTRILSMLRSGQAQEIAAAGQRVARESLTTDCYAERFLEAVA
jgi:hypothetical protein